MGFLFLLSCLFLLAFWSAPTARPVTRASKLIKTHSTQFKAQADKPRSQTSSPLVTPGPQLPSRARHHPLNATIPPLPLPGRCRGPGTAVAPTMGALPVGTPTAPGAAALPAHGTRTSSPNPPAPRCPFAALSQPSPAAASWRRAGGGERRPPRARGASRAS